MILKCFERPSKEEDSFEQDGPRVQVVGDKYFEYFEMF